MNKIKAFIKSLFSNQPQSIGDISYWYYYKGRRKSRYQIFSEEFKINNINDFKKPEINDIDMAYFWGIFNTSGLDGLGKEIEKIRKSGVYPHQFIEMLKKNK